MASPTNKNVKVININTTGYQAPPAQEAEEEFNSFLDNEYKKDLHAEEHSLHGDISEDGSNYGGSDNEDAESGDSDSDDAMHGGSHIKRVSGKFDGVIQKQEHKHTHKHKRGDDSSSSSSSDSESDSVSDTASESSTVQLLSEDPLFLVLAQYFATAKGKNIVNVLEDINTNIKNLTSAISKLASR
jgi:hypothetical protein